MWETESALREALREHEETAGTGRSQALALQRKLDQEKTQRMADISRTTQTHASLLVEANDRIKRLEVCAPPSGHLQAGEHAILKATFLPHSGYRVFARIP